MKKLISFTFFASLTFLFYPTLAQQQNPQQQPASATAAAAEESADEGIPITSQLVQKACVQCHKLDEKMRMSRISYRRTTPEGWQQTIKRMVSLNNLQIEPGDARQVLKYLSNNLGLAPEEARPAAFEVERRMIEYQYSDQETEQICAKCHSMGRVISQRRTQEEWELLVAMHRGYYPISDSQAFRRGGPPETEPGPDGRPPDNRHPMEKAVAHLSEAFPLKTVEWSAWSANMRPPRLQGRWALSGYQPGQGPIYGQVIITPSPEAEDEFLTEARYVYVRSGRSVARNGKAVVYTGFQWRGRSFQGQDESSGLREVMFVKRGWQQISGRWFSGAYDEMGLDISLQRVGNDPVIMGVDQMALRTGSGGNIVRIYGANLPALLSPQEIDLGQGMKVNRVVSANPDLVSIEVQVASDAPVGARDLFLAGATRPAAVVVHSEVDGIKVRPQAGMARIGGANFPKQYQQFEAVAYHNGPDGQPDTEDDLKLGIVDVTWSLEEYTATFGDEDKEFVGAIDAAGLFTPNIDGPNPNRKGSGNNIGDVWVVATYRPDSGEAPIRARAHLVVTVPLYMKWDQPEVAR